jgi:type I restriction enzyme S subunit
MVRDGYKITEVGVIPVDWEVVNLGELFKFKNGINASKEQYGSGYKFINVLDIIENEFISHDEIIGRVNVDVGTFNKNRVDDGDIVFQRSSETAEEVGQAAVYLDKEKSATFGGFVILGKKAGDFDSRYLNYQLQSPACRQEIVSQSGGSTRYNISQVSLRKAKTILPPTRTEQTAIATALSDADALLSALDGLVAKKEAFKRGMMEGLLSGERRLEGFEGEWEETTLSELAHIQTGSKNNQDKVEGGFYPFFVRSPNIERINSYSYEGEAILVPGEGNIGSIFHYINGKFEVHQRVYKIDQFGDNVFPKFIHFHMSQYFGSHAMENSVKATVDSLRLPTFKEFEVSLPSLPEQVAIATLLSDLDAELSALRARREKLGLVKGGMMEVLLSGGVRLV